MMLLDSLIYLLAAVYLDQIMNSGYGPARPWYFLCLPSTWRTRRTAREPKWGNAAKVRAPSTCMHARTPARMHARTHVHTHKHTHTHTHTYAHTHAHTRARAHAHTHASTTSLPPFLQESDHGGQRGHGMDEATLDEEWQPLQRVSTGPYLDLNTSEAYLDRTRGVELMTRGGEEVAAVAGPYLASPAVIHDPHAAAALNAGGEGLGGSGAAMGDLSSTAGGGGGCSDAGAAAAAAAAPGGTVVLEMCGCSMVYPNGVRAVQNMSLQVGRGGSALRVKSGVRVRSVGWWGQSRAEYMKAEQGRGVHWFGVPGSGHNAAP